MPLAGKVLMPREICAAAYEQTPWRNYELTKAIATALGESTGSIGAWHDNYSGDPSAGVTSRDCGLYQINIPAGQIGSPKEASLRTESLDEWVWSPVMENNIRVALDLYQTPYVRDGKQDIRRWQPWVAYTSGWATFPEWWVWHQDADGNPVGPWIATGRFIHRAITGQMNFHIVIKQDWTAENALYYAKRYCGRFGIDPDLLYIRPKDGTLSWHVPPKPQDAPADGVGPRPSQNDGR